MERFNAEDILMLGDVTDRPAELQEKLGSLIHRSKQIRADVECLSTESGEYRVLLRGTLRTDPGDPKVEMEPPKTDEPTAP